MHIFHHLLQINFLSQITLLCGARVPHGQTHRTRQDDENWEKSPPIFFLSISNKAICYLLALFCYQRRLANARSQWKDGHVMNSWRWWFVLGCFPDKSSSLTQNKHHWPVSTHSVNLAKMHGRGPEVTLVTLTSPSNSIQKYLHDCGVGNGLCRLTSFGQCKVKPHLLREKICYIISFSLNKSPCCRVCTSQIYHDLLLSLLA